MVDWKSRYASVFSWCNYREVEGRAKNRGIEVHENMYVLPVIYTPVELFPERAYICPIRPERANKIPRYSCPSDTEKCPIDERFTLLVPNHSNPTFPLYGLYYERFSSGKLSRPSAVKAIHEEARFLVEAIIAYADGDDDLKLNLLSWFNTAYQPRKIVSDKFYVVWSSANHLITRPEKKEETEAFINAIDVIDTHHSNLEAFARAAKNTRKNLSTLIKRRTGKNVSFKDNVDLESFVLTSYLEGTLR